MSKHIVAVVICVLVLLGCTVAPIQTLPVTVQQPTVVQPPTGVVYVDPIYPIPAQGYIWEFHPYFGWGWHHPYQGWYRPYRGGYHSHRGLHRGRR